VVIRLGKPLVAVQEVRSIDVAEIPVGHGEFIEVEVFRLTDDEAAARHVSVVVVAGDLAVIAAIDSDGAVLEFKAL